MLKINELKRLDLGIKGENESKTLQIDMSAWASLYPNATAEILHKRSGDNTKALTGATYDSDTMILTWIPTDTDTFYEGFGVAEIRMVEGNVVKKTKDLIVTAVCPSVIDGSGTIIESTYQAFLNSVISTKQEAVAAKNDAEDAAEDAEDSAEEAANSAAAAALAAQRGPYIDEDTGNWMVWDAEDEEYKNTGIHAQGPQGEPGSVENVRATGIKMSVQDDTTVYNAINARANKVSGAVSGNFAALDANGNLKDSGHKHGDYLTQHQDISGKADKVSSATSGNFAALDENGNLTDSGHKHSDYITDVSGKADKVSSATSGNFAALDENGNLTDSGHKHSDYITDVSGKADKVSSATNGNFAALDANGNLTDSGHKHSDYLTSHQDISGKADKVSSATSGNFAALDENGNLADSGHKHSDYLTSHQDISGKLDKTDFYSTEMPLSSNDSTKLSSKLSAMDSSTSDIRKGLSYVAKLSNGNWQLNSGQNALAGEFISVNGKLGRATSAIIGGSTNIVENTNWVKEDNDGALNELKDELNQEIAKGRETVGIKEDGNTASQTISSGAYVVWKGVLCTADAAIPSGTTLATSGAGKNLTVVSGGAANSLKAVTDALNSNLTTLTGHFSMYAAGTINNNGTISSTEASAGDVFIVSIGGWNYLQLFAIFANNGAEPKKRVIAQYGDSASSAFPVTANGNWGWTISNSTGYNHNYVIFRISK